MKIEELQQDIAQLEGKLARQSADEILKDLEEQAKGARERYEALKAGLTKYPGPTDGGNA